MDWFFLLIAGCGEVVGVAAINRIHRVKTLGSYALLLVGFIMSFLFLSLAMKTIQMATAYAVWTGIGTVGSAVVGMLVYGESKEWLRILFISMVLAAAVGLKLVS